MAKRVEPFQKSVYLSVPLEVREALPCFTTRARLIGEPRGGGNAQSANPEQGSGFRYSFGAGSAGGEEVPLPRQPNGCLPGYLLAWVAA